MTRSAAACPCSDSTKSSILAVRWSGGSAVRSPAADPALNLTWATAAPRVSVCTTPGSLIASWSAMAPPNEVPNT